MDIDINTEFHIWILTYWVMIMGGAAFGIASVQLTGKGAEVAGVALNGSFIMAALVLSLPFLKVAIGRVGEWYAGGISQ